MFNYLKRALLLLGFFANFLGCTSSKLDNENQYRYDVIDTVLHNSGGVICAKILNIDTLLYSEMNIFTFSFLNNNKVDTVLFIVIADKLDKDSVLSSDFEQIKKGDEYCLNLFKIKAPIKTPFIIKGQEFNYKSYIDKKTNLVFYEHGAIVIDVYKSRNIKGIFIRRNL